MDVRTEKNTRRIGLTPGQMQRRKPTKRLDRGGRYVIWSFLEAKDNKAGKACLYIYGTTDHKEEAELYVGEINTAGWNMFNIYISDTYEWLLCPPPHSTERTEIRAEHMQPMIREIMAGHKKHNNDAAAEIERRAEAAKEQQEEVKLRMKGRRKFNMVVAELLDVVPIAITTAQGIGYGQEDRDRLMEEAERRMKEVEAEAKREVEEEMKRLGNLRKAHFRPGLKALFRKRAGHTDFEEEDLLRKEGAKADAEEKKDKVKLQRRQQEQEANKREADKAAVIQRMKEALASAGPEVAAAEQPEPAMKNVVVVPTPPAQPAPKLSRNQRRRLRKRVQKLGAQAEELVPEAEAVETNPIAQYEATLQRLRDAVPTYDAESGMAMTPEQEALRREMQMHSLLEQLAAERSRAMQHIKEQTAAVDEAGGDAEAAADFEELTPEQKRKLLKSAILRKEAERLGQVVPEEHKADPEYYRKRREFMERRKAAVSGATGQDAILKDAGVKMGRTQTHKPKGLQD